MRKSFVHAEKRTKKCTRALIYVLLLLAAFWALCFFSYYQQNGSGDSSPHSPVSSGEVRDMEVKVFNEHDKKKMKEPTKSQHRSTDAIQKSAGDSDDDSIHIIFSTDCSKFQDWQTLLLFHSASVVHQTGGEGGGGSVTRVASGCNRKRKQELVTLYRTLYPSRYHYHVHFTPDFKLDKKTKKKYDFYNKPHGVLHWLEHSSEARRLPPGAVVALIDPDFVFLRRLSPRMAGQANTLLSFEGLETGRMIDRVGKYHPVAQYYGLGAPWVHDRNKLLNRTRICGERSPCLQVPDQRTGSLHYSVGPPYLVEKTDLLRLARSWVQFVPRVYEGYPDLLAEMFAYSLAAAHQQLPHLRMDHFMVSNIDFDEEGWPWVDALGAAVATSPDENGTFFPNRPLPTFVHYCQFYRAAKIGFQKRRMFGDIFSCSRGLFVDLPPGLSGVLHKEREGGEIVPQTQLQVRRSTFMLAVLHSALNSALMHYKAKMCGANRTRTRKSTSDTDYTNVQKTINLADVRY